MRRSLTLPSTTNQDEVKWGRGVYTRWDYLREVLTIVIVLREVSKNASCYYFITLITNAAYQNCDTGYALRRLRRLFKDRLYNIFRAVSHSHQNRFRIKRAERGKKIMDLAGNRRGGNRAGIGCVSRESLVVLFCLGGGGLGHREKRLELVGCCEQQRLAPKCWVRRLPQAFHCASWTRFSRAFSEDNMKASFAFNLLLDNIYLFMSSTMEQQNSLFYIIVIIIVVIYRFNKCSTHTTLVNTMCQALSKSPYQHYLI